jgi:hypothetical protein
MNVINQAFDSRLTALQKLNTGANVLAKFAFNHRMGGFTFPALPKETLQPRQRDEIGTRFA